MLGFRIRKDFMLRKQEARLEKFQSTAGLDVADDQCSQCAHKKQGTLTCKAFPNGIPLGFMTGEYDHSSPYPGDNGILFTPVATNK